MTAGNDIGDLVRNLRRLTGAAEPSASDEARPRRRSAPAIEESVETIMKMLHDHAGFRGSPQIRRKLIQVFRNSEPSELLGWIHEARRPGGEHQLNALVEDLTNHETYFFRDPSQLEVVSHTVIPEHIKQGELDGRRRLRIWSAACSTGEEAYTLAMMAVQALYDAGLCQIQGEEVKLLNGWSLEVLGTDLSRQAVRLAREACYTEEGLGALRRFPPHFRQYLRPAQGAPRGRFHTPISGIRRFVRIEPFNLVSDRPPARDLDIVLCRNVLIYLEHDLHKQIETMLLEGLRRGGTLVLSPVDRFLVPDLARRRQLANTTLYEKR